MHIRWANTGITEYLSQEGHLLPIPGWSSERTRLLKSFTAVGLGGKADETVSLRTVGF